MIHPKGYLIGLLIATGLAFESGCSLDEPDPTSAAPALTLMSEEDFSLTILSWDPVKVTGFKEYILLQSSAPIPNSPKPVVNQDVTILKRINDVDITSFSASPLLFSPQICYKLYCAVDDRFLYSSTLCIEQQIDLFEGFYDRACHMSGIDEMVMFDRVNDLLSTCNYKTGTLTNTVNDFVLSFPSMEMATWDNITNVFGFDQSPSGIRKYDYPTLSNSAFKTYSQILWGGNVHNQFVFVATDEFGKNFQVLSRSNLEAIDTKPGIEGNQNIAVFPGNPITVITAGATSSKKYQIDAAGKIIGEQFIPGRINPPDFQSVCAEGSDLFICGQKGDILNRDGENAGRLNHDLNSFIMVTRLSPDETKAVYVINDGGILRLEIADISILPAVSLTRAYDIPALNYADIIPEDEVIYLIGASFNGNQPQTFILKYPW